MFKAFSMKDLYYKVFPFINTGNGLDDDHLEATGLNLSKSLRLFNVHEKEEMYNFANLNLFFF